MGGHQSQSETLTITIDGIHLDVERPLGLDPGLQKDGVEAHLRSFWPPIPASSSTACASSSTRVRDDIGPVDLLCHDAEGRVVAVEIKRRGEIDGVEQLARYVERLQLDGRLRPVRGLLAAQADEAQAQVLASAGRGIACVEVDYDGLRGTGPAPLTLF